MRPFYASQIKNAPVEIMEMGVQYLTIVMVASFGLYAQFIFERLLQATGRTFFTMKKKLWSLKYTPNTAAAVEESPTKIKFIP